MSKQVLIPSQPVVAVRRSSAKTTVLQGSGTWSQSTYDDPQPSDRLSQWQRALELKELVNTPSRVVWQADLTVVPANGDAAITDDTRDEEITWGTGAAKQLLDSFGITIPITAELSYEKTANGTLRILSKASVPVVTVKSSTTTDSGHSEARKENGMITVHQVVTLPANAVRALTADTSSAKSVAQQLLTLVGIVADAISPVSQSMCPKAVSIPLKSKESPDLAQVHDSVELGGVSGHSNAVVPLKWDLDKRSSLNWDLSEPVVQLDADHQVALAAYVHAGLDNRNPFAPRLVITDRKQTDEVYDIPDLTLARALRGSALVPSCDCAGEALNMTL